MALGHEIQILSRHLFGKFGNGIPLSPSYRIWRFFLTRPRFQKLRQTVDIYFHRVFSKSTECSESLLFTFSLKFLFKASRAPLPSRPLTLAFRARLKISGRRLLRILFSFLLYRSFVSATACVCVCVCVQRKNLERKGGKLQGETRRLQLFCRLNRVRLKAATQTFWHVWFFEEFLSRNLCGSCLKTISGWKHDFTWTEWTWLRSRLLKPDKQAKNQGKVGKFCGGGKKSSNQDIWCVCSKIFHFLKKSEFFSSTKLSTSQGNKKKRWW